jgi:hypothetical protein
MPRRGGRHFVAVPGAEQAMQAFKYEVARHLIDPHSGITLADKVDQVGWEGMATQEVGRIGGAEVKAIMIAGELSIAQRYQQEGRAWIPEMDQIMKTITENESNSQLPRKDFPQVAQQQAPEQRRQEDLTTQQAGLLRGDMPH